MQPTEPIVFVVDDDSLTLAALSSLLDSAGLAREAFDSPDDFLTRYNPLEMGCVVLDMQMPGRTGLEVQREMCAAGATPPILFLSGTADIASSVEAMRGGAVDFLAKPVKAEKFTEAVRSAVAKDRQLWRARVAEAELKRRAAALTPRERQVMAHVVAGKLNKQTASDLGIAEQTIKVHRARVMEKLQVESLADLVRAADRMGHVEYPFPGT
jgi:FixJ family two-component response regulator